MQNSFISSFSNFFNAHKYIKPILFVSIFLLTSYSLDIFLTSLVKASNHDDFSMWTKVVGGKASSDIVVFGSSRAMVHYDCNQVESALGKTCINLGLNASRPIMQKPLLETYFAHNKVPQLIIFALDSTSLSKPFDRSDIFNDAQYMPYLAENAVFNNLASINKNYYFYKYIPLLDFISYKDNLTVALKTLFNKEPTWRIRRDKLGFAGLDTKWDGTFEKYINERPNGTTYLLDENRQNIIIEIIEIAKKHGSNVLVTYPPELKEAHKYLLNRDEILDIYLEIANKQKVPFIDYSSSNLNNSRKYFYNSQHLNAEGAKIFTRALIGDLMELGYGT